RELSIAINNCFVIAFGGIEEFEVPGLLIIDTRLAKTLGDIDIVPIDDVGVPARHIMVDFRRQLEEEAVAGMIIKPVNRLYVVREADFRPVTGAEILRRLRIQPLEILRQER